MWELVCITKKTAGINKILHMMHSFIDFNVKLLQ